MRLKKYVFQNKHAYIQLYVHILYVCAKKNLENIIFRIVFFCISHNLTVTYCTCKHTQPNTCSMYVCL